jgi:hypothetical protein
VARSFSAIHWAALAHAAKISSGGAPVMLIAEEQTFTF